ncbi:hypothetical protein X798_05496 [Onchocerca flexuosa]|uniref:Uncharacterized protein n=1 Tax=Onchocerca flexuosa TaxID=387005 RepID=A0A238BQH9_9BILA|nr:hypothetical protein X798_05496 [Onchocerca flexuosa]
MRYFIEIVIETNRKPGKQRSIIQKLKAEILKYALHSVANKSVRSAGNQIVRIRYFWTLFIPNAMFSCILQYSTAMSQTSSFNFLPSFLLEIFGESINIPSRIFITLASFCLLFSSLTARSTQHRKTLFGHNFFVTEGGL